ncbi:MAG: MFS transporter [Alphaproteobacteria bacterium]
MSPSRALGIGPDVAPQPRTLSIGSYIAYGVPALPIAAFAVPIYIYIPPFYAQNLGISLAAIGTALTLARIIDALAQPVIGILSDRIISRWGRRKPWIGFSAPFILIAAIMLCMPPPGSGSMYLFLWSVVIYLASSTLTLPYSAWGAELSGDYHERSHIVAWREGLTVIGTLIATMIPGLAIKYGGGDAQLPLISIAVFACILLPPCIFYCLRKVPETPVLHFGNNDWRAGLRIVFRNHPFRLLLAAFLLNGVANSLPATLFLLFVTHVLHSAEHQGGLLFAYFAAGVISVPFWLWLARRYSKHRIWGASMLWACLMFIWVPFLARGDVAAFLTISIMSGIALGADMVLPASMQADVVDMDTLESGSQRTGLYFAMWSVATKLSLAGAVGIAFPLLGFIGFDAQASENSGDTLLGLALLYSIVPVALKILSAMLIWNFPIDAASQARIRLEIEQRSTSGHLI